MTKSILGMVLCVLAPGSCFALPPQNVARPQTVAVDAGKELLRAQALIRESKNDEAIQLLKALARHQPEPAGIEAGLGKAYYQKSDFRQAVPHLELALKQNATDLETAQLLGLSYSRLGRASDAIPLLEKVQSSLPHPDPTGFYVLGVSYLQTHQFDKAREAFARMFSVSPDSAGAHLVLGQMMIHRELEDQAAPELTQALAMDPRMPMAHFLLGEVDLYRGRVQDALSQFQAELRSNPISWLAYWRMGDADTRLERWDDAERALKQAIWLDQTFTGPYVLLGKVELNKGDAALAKGYLDRALQMDPSNASAHYLLGTAYKSMGWPEDAEREFEISRKLHTGGGP